MLGRAPRCEGSRPFAPAEIRTNARVIASTKPCGLGAISLSTGFDFGLLRRRAFRRHATGRCNSRFGRSRSARRGSRWSTSQYPLQVGEQLGRFKHGCELVDDTNDAGHVEILVSVQESLDIRRVAWPMRDGLHHHEIFRSGQRNADPPQLVDHGVRDRLLFERKRAERDVDVDPARAMTDSNGLRGDVEGASATIAGREAAPPATNALDLVGIGRRPIKCTRRLHEGRQLGKLLPHRLLAKLLALGVGHESPPRDEGLRLSARHVNHAEHSLARSSPATSEETAPHRGRGHLSSCSSASPRKAHTTWIRAIRGGARRWGRGSRPFARARTRRGSP